MVDLSSSPVGWLASADLVIGEHDCESWHRREICRHYAGGCLFDQTWAWLKWKYQCEEYEQGGRLWFPRAGEPSRPPNADEEEVALNIGSV